MPLPQNNNFQDMQQGIDRITSILQQQSQPRAMSPLEPQASSVPLNIQQALLSASLDVGRGGGSFIQNLQNYENTSLNRERQNNQDILGTYDAKLKLGDRQTKALDDKISLFTGDDAEGKALFLQMLHEDPEEIDPSNSFQIMTKLAQIKKKTGYESPSLSLDRAKTQADIDYKNALSGKMRGGSSGLGDGGFGKPPTGYRFLPDGSLEPIPGGPGEKISAELSARLGLAKKFLGEAPEIKQQVQKGTATGLIDYTQGKFGFGESGKIQRRIADGADALQRMLTGAGMPASEAEDYSNRFRATAKDTDQTLTDKITNLETVLRAQIEMASRGHGNVLGELPQQEGQLVGTSGGKKIYQMPDGSYEMEE